MNLRRDSDAPSSWAPTNTTLTNDDDENSSIIIMVLINDDDDDEGGVEGGRMGRAPVVGIVS